MNQFFAPLAEPVGAVWLLMVLGVVRLLWRHQWRSALWLGFPVVLLFIVGSTSLAEILVAAEERPWVGGMKAGEPLTDVGRQGAESDRLEIGNLHQLSTTNSPPTNAPADAVVALGGGQHVSNYDALGFAMGDGGSRILTAIELVRSGQARILVLGGSWPMPGRPNVPSMCAVQNWVTSWGLTGGVVTNLGICINTYDEAVAFKKLAQAQSWRRVVLVTSALHMRRSVALFKRQGIQITPAAADFHVAGVSQDLPFSPFPRQHRLHLLTLYMHEKIGWCLYRIKGWV